MLPSAGADCSTKTRVQRGIAVPRHVLGADWRGKRFSVYNQCDPVCSSVSHVRESVCVNPVVADAFESVGLVVIVLSSCS
jgi:hypothetical protein